MKSNNTKNSKIMNMGQLNVELKNGEYHQIYLLTGEEDYLRRQYRDRLKNVLVPPDSMGASMNIHYYTGKLSDVKALVESADTMPFMADRRLFILEEVSFENNGEDILIQYLSEPASTAFFVLVYENMDKRSRLYKAIEKNGVVVEFTKLDDKRQLGIWLAKKAADAGLKIENGAIEQLIAYVGFDMTSLSNEMEKLIGYCLNNGKITAGDVQAVCVKNPEDAVFSMVDAISEGQLDKAMIYYKDLIFRREPPVRLLSLVIRQYRIILQYIEAKENGKDPMSVLKLPAFLRNKYNKLANNVGAEKALWALQKCIEADESFKRGKMTDKLAFETLLVELAG